MLFKICKKEETYYKQKKVYMDRLNLVLDDHKSQIFIKLVKLLWHLTLFTE